MNKKILLLNPPSEKRIQRDFLCSASSKADYYWTPIDFAVLSGILKDEKVEIFDAIAENKQMEEILESIKNKKFDYIISLVSSIDFDNEEKILKKIKSANENASIIVLGDIAFFEKERVIESNAIDAILLDFSSHEILKYIENPKNERIKDMMYKSKNRIIFRGFSKNKEFSYGFANLGLFRLKNYSVPYSIYHPIAPILMNYGCPYRCEFCSSGRIGYKLRNAEEAKKEIKMFEKQGFKEMFVRDFNFTTNREFVKEICNFMIENKMKIAWSCEGRVDNVDYEILSLMKKAGCYLIFFGVEFSSKEKLKKFEKNINPQQIKKIFSFCKELGIKTLASFIIGMPEDSRKDILSTIEFSKEIGADYASFNLYVPRYGSILREKLKKENKIGADNKFDSSKDFANFTMLTDSDIMCLHKYALKSFYFRPKYLFGKLLEIKTFSQIKNHARNALKLALEAFR